MEKLSNDRPPPQRAKANQNSIKHQRSSVNNKSTNLKNLHQHNTLQESERLIRKNSKTLTVCLLCFVAAILTLSPYLSLHLTEQIGLLLFEADLVHLRSSQISSIVCLLFLILLLISIVIYSNYCDKSANNNIRAILVKISKKLLPLAAIISSLAYLSIVLLVPHIKQIQRPPLATFDCDANLITIENCQQSYTHRGAKVLRYILIGEQEYGEQDYDNQNDKDWPDGNGERLIRDLNCLRYNDESLKSIQVPTNFLLHSCGLVCKPQRQQYHQFGDDLNYSNETKQIETDQQQQHAAGQVSLKVCFSDEIGGSNYKQYCITNLADHNQKLQKQDDKTLTLGQLNALLRTKNAATINRRSEVSDYESTFSGDLAVVDSPVSLQSTAFQPATLGPFLSSNPTDDQATHYVNPIVQFESHFKNWPYLSNNNNNHNHNQLNDFEDSSAYIKSTTTSQLHHQLNHRDGWCQFRPIPPFIVNNKPFSEIKCSIEQEYTMSTGGHSQADRIYLKKSISPLVDGSKSEGVDSTNNKNERCNIQCKVNILYQVRLQQLLQKQQQQQQQSNQFVNSQQTTTMQHYYLPMKSCNMISGESKKESIIRQCVIFRSIGDSALTICFLLIDLLLLLESIDTKQFYLEQNKSRFLGILLIVLLIPILVALQFDLIQWDQSGKSYFGTFFNENLLPYFHEFFNEKSSNKSHESTTTTDTTTTINSNYPTIFHFDNYLLPVINFTLIILVLAIGSKGLQASSRSIVSLIRVSSTEELGLAGAVATPGRRSVSPYGQAGNGDNLSDIDSNLVKGGERAAGGNNSYWIEVLFFTLVSLLLGTQFYLNLTVQSLILRETFGGGSWKGKKYSALLYGLSTNTGPALVMVALAFVFRNEMSTFFANFSPFNCYKNRPEDDELIMNKNRAKFLKYTCLALTIYSLRSILLSNLNKESRFKYPIVFLFHLSELFNFPLVWFALYKRAHELLMQQYHPTDWHLISPLGGGMIDQQQHQNDDATKLTTASLATEKALRGHSIIQTTLAFIYFALARLVALTFHSLNVGLHLHSDDVDWFITSFERQLKQTHLSDTTTTTTATTTINRQQTKAGGNNSTMTVDNYVNNINISDSSSRSSRGSNGGTTNNNLTSNNDNNNSLFSPLPSEHQTYLHASRLFLKYNSLLCLLVATLLASNFLYTKYQIWSDQRRTLNVSFSSSARNSSNNNNDNNDDDDSEFNQQLSMDLMQVRRESKPPPPPTINTITSTRLIYPSDISNRSETSTSRADTPKARVLFHYQVDRRNRRSAVNRNRNSPSSSVSSSSSSSGRPFTTVPPPSAPADAVLPPPPQVEILKQIPVVRVINVDRGDEDCSEPSKVATKTPSTKSRKNLANSGELETQRELESTINYRNKSVRILEHKQNEHPIPISSISNRDHSADLEGSAPTGRTSGETPERKRTISFAPEATFIGSGERAQANAALRRQNQPIKNYDYSKFSNTTTTTTRTSSKIVTIKTASPEPSIGSDESDVDEVS